MPHYSNYGGTYLSAQPADELNGTFNALNETTDFKPTQREEIGVIHPSYMPTQGDEIGVIHPSYKPEPRGYDPVPIDTLSKTFRDVDQRMIGSTSGEGVFKTETNGYWDWTGEPTPNDVYCGPHSCSSIFKTENFESMEAMTSFAGFFNHVPGGEGFQPREGASVEIGNPPEPKLWLQILG